MWSRTEPDIVPVLTWPQRWSSFTFWPDQTVSTFARDPKVEVTGALRAWRQHGGWILLPRSGPRGLTCVEATDVVPLGLEREHTEPYVRGGNFQCAAHPTSLHAESLGGPVIERIPFQ